MPSSSINNDVDGEEELATFEDNLDFIRMNPFPRRMFFKKFTVVELMRWAVSKICNNLNLLAYKKVFSLFH